MMRGLFLFVALLLPLAPARALESAAVRSSRVVATLVSDVDTVQPGVPMHLGLRLRMAPGWHTYWSNPGDAGVAPELALTLSGGATAGSIDWPTPLRLPEGPVMTYGYTGDIVLPVVVTPGQGAFHVDATASWLVCDKVCVPEEGVFGFDLPNGVFAPSPQAGLFAAAAARQPRPSPFPATFAPDGSLTLVGPGLSAASVEDAWFFPESSDAIDQGAAQTVQTGDGFVRIGLKRGSVSEPDALLRGTVVLKDKGGTESYLSVAATPGGPSMTELPVWRLVLLAFAGGLILNLMPCVFPILAMKAVALTRLSGRDHSAVRVHAVSYTVGVLVAFGTLAALLLGLRYAGIAAGWGFQFQSPVFVAVMAWLLFSVGLNLSGVFHVGARLVGVGQGFAGRGGVAGSFVTGLLAVIVATPCTAPFMGIAIAAALAAPYWQAVLIFLALGFGLAFPYALLAIRPQWAGLLPRPGAWMDVLRGALAFPMYAAAGWLVWVVSLQAGSEGLLATIVGMVLLGLALWSLGLAQKSGRRLGLLVAAAAAFGVCAVVPGLFGAQPAANAAIASEGIEPFSPARLAALRAEGRPVFVNMTAAWCVTCLVNERLALSPAAVRQAFADRRVAYLKGDWTRSDPAISAFLRKHDRDGVPLYLLYPAGKPPIILPQILTEAGMLSELRQIGG